MGTRKFKPSSPGRREMVGLDFEQLTQSTPEKSLIFPLRKNGGRNNKGRITARHRGGGAKRRFRLIDFKRDKDGVPGRVASIEYDPNRTANIALLHYTDGEKRYILAPIGLKLDSQIVSGEAAEIRPGNCLPFSHIPVGTEVHNLELKAGAGAKLVRSAGMSAQIVGRELGYAHVRLPSGSVRRIPLACRATVGRVGNAEAENVVQGKAGRNRYRGWRPHVRGTAMNPVDHPHGGGEGKSKGRHPVTPWGVATKGKKTRSNPRTDHYILKSRKSG